MEYLWGNIKALCEDPKYTHHLVLVTEEDTKKNIIRRTTNTGVDKNSSLLPFSVTSAPCVRGIAPMNEFSKKTRLLRSVTDLQTLCPEVI